MIKVSFLTDIIKREELDKFFEIDPSSDAIGLHVAQQICSKLDGNLTIS